LYVMYGRGRMIQFVCNLCSSEIDANGASLWRHGCVAAPSF
jgi:hypothetical protein